MYCGAHAEDDKICPVAAGVDRALQPSSADKFVAIGTAYREVEGAKMKADGRASKQTILIADLAWFVEEHTIKVAPKTAGI